MIKQGPRQEPLGRLGIPIEGRSESKLKKASNKLSSLSLNQTKDGKSFNAAGANHSATSDVDSPVDVSLSANPSEGQLKAASPKSYQGAKDELKELPPKKPIKLAPLELSEDVKKAQLEKLRDIQIEAKIAAEKLAAIGAINIEHQPKKVRNRKQLENLEKIRLAEKTLLENQKAPKHLLQEASFLPAKISFSSTNRKLAEPVLPSKPMVPIITKINAKFEIAHEAQSYIPAENPESSQRAVRGRLRLRHGKGCDNGTRDKSKPLKPMRLTFSNGNISEELNTASQQTEKELCEASKLLNNGARRKYTRKTSG